MTRFSILVLAVVGLVHAQTSSDFDVASIRPTDSSLPTPGRFAPIQINTTPGRLTVRNASLKDLIRAAWSLEDYQVTGGPAWAASARFDVEGKAAEVNDREKLLIMLRTLLADRFGLSVHRETKEVAINALVVAKSGPKFRALDAVEASCWPACPGTPGKMNHLRMSDLAFLARYLTRLGGDKPVIDKSGLSGRFALDLDMNKIMAAVAERPEPPDNHSIYEATTEFLADQLDLQLVPMNASISVLVIDQVRTPSAN